jgi:hypothetical protein
MEEVKQSRLTIIEKLREDLISSTKSEIEILHSARLGTDEYDFYDTDIIKEGGLSTVFLIKSKIDGKEY